MLEGMVVDSYLELPTGSCETVFMLIRMKNIRFIFFFIRNHHVRLENVLFVG